MKIRFGVGLGAEVAPPELPAVVDRLESTGVDSLWLSELVYSPAVEPFVGMAHALGRTSRLKVGTSVAVLPGRHPVLVAKQLASLAALAPKRVLPVFGLRSAMPAEREAFVVPAGRRGAVFDESLRLLRASLEGPTTFSGEFFSVRDVEVLPKPASHLDIWLGGSSRAGYRRIGELGDGWLGSFVTPDEARDAVRTIRAFAEAAGREVPEDHYGINLAVGDGDLPAPVIAAIRTRRPDLDPEELVARDWAQLHRRLDRYIDAGLTKFVIRPAGRGSIDAFLDAFVTELLPREN
ncbi:MULTISPECIES: TIGR03854 family LLM class F420-dependent oxidoreductase [Mycolicibacterium]|uniref:Flavin-dependent oxidoreductase, F420-dependent methylene-tetrahydromethanopterin reductase n=1 Tax=Mycolicibacterium gilvum (strain DSM 45189 / LMG 24558 / Spyr1) TaxID=278137 RepID=E6TK63_MYCSR|nr:MULTISPECIES: TIGR03854 family LLM class F420-dependent oxidoreductase [Mycolicibacterium]ADT99208.1 flavin-dependent oxidoreductase, F420-dependent methylene-tetrahydromethanopterin reductase [Mycolicibacterium gilvum Spyr1]MBV5243660.1 TIGR03854 family LLM class F420-dependent oxidoreductase [Mycolicibacterium sp. PAM1]